MFLIRGNKANRIMLATKKEKERENWVGKSGEKVKKTCLKQNREKGDQKVRS